MSAAVTSPRIVCLDWCTVSREEHLEELRDPFVEGDVHHRSAPQAWATLAHMVSADGVPHEGDDPAPSLRIYAREVATVAEAEEIIRDLHAAVAALTT